MVVRSVDRPILVLGSTQAATVVDLPRLRHAGVELVRRRSGGGAVLLGPGAQVWVDMWVPRDDSLWSDEPRRSAERVGEWWAASLSLGLSPGDGRVTVHRGPAVPGPAGDLVCFAGVGAGEVLVDGRKLVGLAQWRSRQGALVHGCAYRAWDPAGIAGLLATGARARKDGTGDPEGDGGHAALAAALDGCAVGLDEVGAAAWTVDQLLAALPDRSSWEILRD